MAHATATTAKVAIIVMADSVQRGGMETEEFLARFSVSFSWDYPDDWCLNDVVSSVFHIIDDQDERSQDQLVCNSVQAAGAGVLLTQPHPETDIIPCEMTFTAHPVACEFCVTKVLVVSEARNVELYIDGMYEKTTKGVMLTLRKGKNAALYESEFDLSAHIQGSNKITIKFVSMPDKQILRLQTVMVKVTSCPRQTGIFASPKGVKRTTVEMEKVKEMMKSMGVSIPTGGQQLMNQIEQQQHHQTQGIQLQQLMSLGLGMTMPQFGNQASSSGQSTKPFSKDVPTEKPRRANERYEESLLANAILSTEKAKRETQRVIDQQERLAERDAQINILKQMLLSTPQRGEQKSVKEHQCHHKSSHDGDAHERSYKEMLERLIAESNVGSYGPSVEFGTQRDGLDSFIRSQNRASFRSDLQSNISSHASRPLSLCCSDISDRDFQRLISESEDVHKKQHQPIFPANSKRCQDCGCPGCLSVYNAITTNIYAMEERLIGRMDIRMQEISRFIDNKFEALRDVFSNQQQQIASHLFDTLPRSQAAMKPGKDSILHRTESS